MNWNVLELSLLSLRPRSSSEVSFFSEGSAGFGQLFDDEARTCRWALVWVFDGSDKGEDERNSGLIGFSIQ